MFLAFLIHFQYTHFFVLFAEILLLILDTLLSKSVFATKFARDNLALKISAAKVLNSVVVKYLS